jgi:hypothetical protein
MFSSSTRKSSSGAPPGPICFNPQQMSSYLSDLRNNRPQRPGPTGARPLPSSFSRKGTIRSPSNQVPEPQTIIPSTRLAGARIPSDDNQVIPAKRNVSNGSTASRHPSLYNKNDVRQKQERKVSHEISAALKKLDLQEEEERIQRAAREEADELMRRYLRPSAPYRPQHSVSKKEERSSSHREDWQAESKHDTGQKNSRESVKPSVEVMEETKTRKAQMPDVQGMNSLRMGKQRSPLNFDPFSVQNLANRRRSSGSKRLASGGSPKTVFVNPEDKIYEDPKDRLPEIDAVPAHVRRNPFARLRSKREGQPRQSEGSVSVSSRLSRTETQNSLPSQARDAGYGSNAVDIVETSGHAVAHITSNQLEIRSDELRAATSMRLKDRSPRLVAPTAVSDSPGRPIVSFKPDWAPPEMNATSSHSHKEPERPQPLAFRVKTAHLTDEPSKKSSLELPRITRDSPPPSRRPQEESMPFIHVVDTSEPVKASPATPHPYIDVSNNHIAGDIPSFSFSADDGTPSLRPQISITTEDYSPSGSSISVSTFPEPPAMSISVSESAPPTRQLRDPTAAGSRHNHQSSTSFHSHRGSDALHHHTHHASGLSSSRPQPRHTPSIRQTTATCTHCTLPISGRVVTASRSLFHPSCFTCHHCATPLEHVSFYPEPSSHRTARLDRIAHRREAPTDHYFDDETEAKIAEDDGWDDGMRFYCHLDYHEKFSPRCKGCRTPIEGEVVVALGAEWHVGHFFCAECGDVSYTVI